MDRTKLIQLNTAKLVRRHNMLVETYASKAKSSDADVAVEEMQEIERILGCRYLNSVNKAAELKPAAKS